MRPVTVNDGMKIPAWYDIKSLTSRNDLDVDGLSDTKSIITSIIDNEIKLGIPTSKIILGGFSQGGATALYLGYTYNRSLAGVVALSTYLPNITTFSRVIIINFL